jgi:hypothetical protein
MDDNNKPWHWNPTFPGLMDELIIKIFSFCSTEKLVICSMVCKRWRKLVTHPSLRLVMLFGLSFFCFSFYFEFGVFSLILSRVFLFLCFFL